MDNKVFALIGLVIALSCGYLWYANKKDKRSTYDSNILVVGTDAGYPPFEFIENNELVGFDVDLTREIGKRLGKAVEFKNMAFDGLIIQLQLGTIDMIAAGMTPSAERAKQVLFTSPYMEPTPLVVIALKDKKSILSISDLKGKTIAVNQGFSADLELSKIGSINLVRLSSAMTSDGILAIQSGRADAFVANKNAIQPFLETQIARNYIVTTLTGTDETSALAIAKSKPELFKQIQDALDAIKKDGTLDALKKKWKFA